MYIQPHIGQSRSAVIAMFSNWGGTVKKQWQSEEIRVPADPGFLCTLFSSPEGAIYIELRRFVVPLNNVAAVREHIEKYLISSGYTAWPSEKTAGDFTAQFTIRHINAHLEYKKSTQVMSLQFIYSSQ